MSYDDWRLAANESICDFMDCADCPAPCECLEDDLFNPDGSIKSSLQDTSDE